jgi:hypothetical protein
VGTRNIVVRACFHAGVIVDHRYHPHTFAS